MVQGINQNLADAEGPPNVWNFRAVFAAADYPRPGHTALVVSMASVRPVARHPSLRQKVTGTRDIRRASPGAMENRFKDDGSDLRTRAENLRSAASRISDANIALEMTEFVRDHILSQSTVTRLLQKQSLPGMALALVGGE